MYSAVQRQQLGNPLQQDLNVARIFLLNGESQLGLDAIHRVMRKRGYIDENNRATAKITPRADNAYGALVYYISWNNLTAENLDRSLDSIGNH